MGVAGILRNAVTPFYFEITLYLNFFYIILISIFFFSEYAYGTLYSSHKLFNRDIMCFKYK